MLYNKKLRVVALSCFINTVIAVVALLLLHFHTVINGKELKIRISTIYNRIVGYGISYSS